MNTGVKSKKKIFGFGTGRCGTVSLSKLLNLQEESSITHETPFPLPWKINLPRFRKYYKVIVSRGGYFVGDVSFSWINYIDFILENDGDSKIIGLIREKEKVVDSLYTKTSKNIWTEDINKKNRYYYCFPKSKKGTSKKEALNRYYDIYVAKMFELESQYTKNIRLFKTEDLNDKAKVIEILGFCEFNNPKVVVGIKLNEKK